MPTFLTTRKMDPELRARIRASISGRKKGMRSRVGPRMVALARFLGVATLFAIVVSAALLRRRAHEELETTRNTLLTDVHQKSAQLTAENFAVVPRADELVAAFARPYPGDTIEPDLRGSDALARTLARPILYVRGPIGTMGSSQSIALSATVSSKDPLVACLVDPPKLRTEKSMLPKVRAAYARDVNFEKATQSVSRLDDAVTGLPLLSPAWASRVSSAEDLTELAHLRHDFQHAPTDGAIRAAKSELLFVAMDEEGDRKGPTELDGERPHNVRVALFDLTTKRALLRFQRGVDPKWISESARAEYAAGLDGCGLAKDIRDAIEKAP